MSGILAGIAGAVIAAILSWLKVASQERRVRLDLEELAVRRAQDSAREKASAARKHKIQVLRDYASKRGSNASASELLGLRDPGKDPR